MSSALPPRRHRRPSWRRFGCGSAVPRAPHEKDGRSDVETISSFASGVADVAVVVAVALAVAVAVAAALAVAVAVAAAAATVTVVAVVVAAAVAVAVAAAVAAAIAAVAAARVAVGASSPRDDGAPQPVALSALTRTNESMKPK